ncbi:putative zinc-binding metallopeptidase [Bradyrhizobium sp. Gha]
MNRLNRSLGLADAYPFDISPAVKGKLHLVHMSISAFRNRHVSRATG